MSHSAEPADDAFISVFTPSQTKDEYLEAIFVQRHALLNDTVERIHESAATSNKHHLLFVGPRGSGKTHLVTLLVHRLGQRPDITQNLRIAWLNEDETSTTVLDLLLRIYQALAKRYPNVYSAASLETAFELDVDEAQRFLTELLLESISQERTTILVVVENLDALFEGLGDIGQKQLRALIQENPRFAIVATAQHLSDYLRSRNHPFFGFFQTAHFKPLTEAEAAELLGKISLLKERPKVARFLRTRKGRARIRALHHLSGGNHRVYIVLSQFVTQDSIDALVTPFIKMVDELTPYYQERLRWLPPQQRKIVEFLSTSTRPVSVKNIAKRLFATPQTISSQLKDLRTKGYVVSTQRGRESLYEITEPLMRICVEVKENKSSEPLALLVDFIRAWYDQSDLTQRLANKEISTTARPYLLAALKKSEAQEFGVARALEKSHANPAQNFSHLVPDESNETVADYTTIGIEDAPVEEVALALFSRGFSYEEKGELDKAITDYTTVINLEGVSVSKVVSALIIRGYLYEEKGEVDNAVADYTTVINLEGVSVEKVASTLIGRGITYGQNGEIEKEIADYTTVINLEGAPLEEVASALVFRSYIYDQNGDLDEAIAGYTAVINLEGAPVKEVALAFVNRGHIYIQNNEFDKAIADFTAAINLEDVPVGRIASALISRGYIYGQKDELDKAIADFTAAVDLEGISVEKIASALVNRGYLYDLKDESNKAVADYTAVINLESALVEEVTLALFNRGITYYLGEEMSKALADFGRVITFKNAPAERVVFAYMNSAEIHISEGRWSEGVTSVQKGLQVSTATTPPQTHDASDLIGAIFSASLDPALRKQRIAEFVRLYVDHEPLTAILGAGLVKHLGSLYQADAALPSADNLDLWLSAWEEVSQGVDKLQVPMRIFRTGAAFLKTGGEDQSILLDLTENERSILQQAFGMVDA